MSDFSDDAQREWGMAKAEGKLDDTSKADELREQLAAIEHERWASWQRWVHMVYENPTRPFEEAIANWKKQIDTPYADLSDREKASDMEQVDRYWALITAHSHQAQRELLDRLIASSDVVTDHDLMATGVTKDEYVNLSVIDAERKRLEGTTDD